MASKATLIGMQQVFIPLILLNSLVIGEQNPPACSAHFSGDHPVYGPDSFVELKDLSISEDAETGTGLFVLTWDEAEATAPFPKGELFEKYFSVELTEKSTWTCTLKEQLIGVPDYPDSNGTITADTSFTQFSDYESCYLEITITVSDTNTATPEFENAPYSIDIDEDWPVNTPVETGIRIRDRDKIEPNNVVIITVDDNCPVSPNTPEYKGFDGNFKDVDFVLRNGLDYESTNSYDCTVTLQDQGSKQLSTDTSLTITVNDKADEPPVFESPFYTAEVIDPEPEKGGTPLDTKPGPISAEDGDKGAPSKLTYKMTDFTDLSINGPGTSYFQIDPDSGVVSLIATIEEEVLTQGRFLFILTATDESLASGTSILEVILPPIPTTTPVPTTTTAVPTTTPEPTTTAESTSVSPLSTDSSSSSHTPSTTVSSMTESTTDEYSSPSSQTPSTTASSMTVSTTTSSMTDISTTSSVTKLTTTPIVTYSTSSTTTTPEPEAGLEFTKDTYAAYVTEQFGDEFLKVDVIVKGIERDAVKFLLEDDDSKYFEISSPDGGIKLKTGTEVSANDYSFKVKATADTPDGFKESAAEVIVKVLPAPPTDLSLTQSLHLPVIREDAEEEQMFEISQDDAASIPVSFCIVNVNPTKYDGYFETVQTGDSWYVRKVGNPIDYEETQEVRFVLQAYDSEVLPTACQDKTTLSLLRNEALVVVAIEDLNDEIPVLKVPESSVETIFYPKDVALQKIVGPIITIEADDADLKDTELGEKITYLITNEEIGFSIEKETGAIYARNGFSCETNECQILVQASDALLHLSEVASINVKSLDMSSIFTLTMNDTEVWEVENKLKTLSQDIGLQVSKVYVNSEIKVSTEVQQSSPVFASYRRYREMEDSQYRNYRSSSNEGEEHWQIEVNVYAMDGGNLVELENLNNKLAAIGYAEAAPFVDEEIFSPSAPEDNTGLIAAVSVLASLLAIVLLIGGFLGFRRYRSKRQNSPKNISTVGGAYPNHGFTDDEDENKSTISNVSQKSDNGSISKKNAVERFNPPLHASSMVVTTDSLTSGESRNDGKVGLRRTDPGTPEYYGISSRDPPPSYNKDNFNKDKPLNGSVSRDTSSSTYTSLSSNSNVQPQPTPTYLTKNPKKAPPPLNTAPTKSILRGKSGSESIHDIPLYTTSYEQKDPIKPSEPTVDYKDADVEVKISPSFSGLKGSPKLKKKILTEEMDKSRSKLEDVNVASADNHSGKASFQRDLNATAEQEEKKSNLKQQDNTESDRGEEEEKSVAFKVLVDMKVVETENAGPAQRAAKVAEAKSDALEILEANRMKMEAKGQVEEDDDIEELSSL